MLESKIDVESYIINHSQTFKIYVIGMLGMGGKRALLQTLCNELELFSPHHGAHQQFRQKWF